MVGHWQGHSREVVFVVAQEVVTIVFQSDWQEKGVCTNFWSKKGLELPRLAISTRVLGTGHVAELVVQETNTVEGLAMVLWEIVQVGSHNDYSIH